MTTMWRVAAAAALSILSTLVTAATAGAMVVGMQSDNLILSTPADRQNALDVMAALDVKVVRFTISWRNVAGGCAPKTAADERALARDDNPCYSWGTTDAIVQDAVKRHIHPLVSVTQTPEWAGGMTRPFYTGGTEAQYAVFLARYSAFLQAAGARYGPPSRIGHVRYWTIWNEPNSRASWGPWTPLAPHRYARMLMAAAMAIHGVSPGALVAAGPTGPSSSGMKPVTYIRQVQEGLADAHEDARIDAWAHNPYTGGLVPPGQPFLRTPAVGIGNINDLITALDASPTTRGLPLWFTEFGYQTNPPDTTYGVSPADQADYLADYFAIAAHSGRVNIALWYVLRDPVEEADWQSGLLDAANQFKPSFGMYRLPVSTTAASDGAVDVWGRGPRGATLVSRAASRPIGYAAEAEPPGFLAHVFALIRIAVMHDRALPVKRAARAGLAPDDGTWTPIGGQIHHADGTITARFAPQQDAQVAVRVTGHRVGPARNVRAVT